MSHIRSCRKAAALIGVLIAAVYAGIVPGETQGSPEPAFEVASVKANRSGEPYVGAPGDRFSDGRFRYTNVPLRLLIRQAFERPGSDTVRGGPAWLDTDRWDFDAKAESATADMLPMIRKLLTERFRLRHHIESEEGPVYELTFARRDRRLGSSLRQARGSRSFRGGSGSITGRALSILDLARLLRYGRGASGARSHRSHCDVRRRSPMGTGQSRGPGTLGPSRLLHGDPGAALAQTATGARPRGPDGDRQRRAPGRELSCGLSRVVGVGCRWKLVVRQFRGRHRIANASGRLC